MKCLSRSTILLYLSVLDLTAATSPADNFAPTKSIQHNPDTCAFDPNAKVSDACASYAYLNDINKRISGYVHNVVRTTDFFSYYRLNLYNKKCPFWSDEDGLCGNIACAVTTLEKEDDIPSVWRAAELSKLEGPKAQHPDKKQQAAFPEKPLHGDLGANVGESCVVEYDDECDERDYCVPEDERSSAKGDYVSLVDNPERFTGYAGDGAHQVWDAIYRENCFSKPLRSLQSTSSALSSSPFGGLSGNPKLAAMDLREVMKDRGRQLAMERGTIDDQMEFDDECVEKRIFYRVISGMHASISIHLCHDYLNQTTGQWGPNLQCYEQRLHNRPERISNLYFNYALVLRAVSKLRDYIGRYTFCSGDYLEDARTKSLVSILASALPSGQELFDESILFQDSPAGGSGIALKEDFRNRFRNISRIMDCVGCDKCRLWGKLQTAGYGTALKVLFELGNGDQDSQVLLRRTELVALINTLDKISHAIQAVSEFEQMLTPSETASSSPMPNSPLETSTSKKSSAETEDDGHVKDAHDHDTPASKRRERVEITFADSFWMELDHVWKAYKMVLSGWLSLPNTIYRIVASELDRLWSLYIGFPVQPRSWSIRRPPRFDEL